jgi:hypothetical protein
MTSIFEQIKLENIYEMFFPKKEQGLAIIWLYEKVKNGDFDKGIFRESDIWKALDESSLINREKRERQPRENYNSHIMALQEFFLFYDVEQQTYSFKEYAIHLCENVIKMLSNRFNPTAIEIICIDLYEKLNLITDEPALSQWLHIHFDKDKSHLKEQIDYLDQQIDKSVAEFSETAKLQDNSLLSALRAIESKIDEVSDQNQKLRKAFREIDKIKRILSNHPVRETNSELDDEIRNVMEYFESISIRLNMVDSRISKIHPKIQQFFASLNRQQFDKKVEKFLLYLLDKSQIVSGELKFPIEKEELILHLFSSNYTIIEKRDILFPVKRTQYITYPKNTQKENEVYQLNRLELVRQNNINLWIEKIKRESQYETEFHLSDVFFRILDEHNRDLQLAVNVIYSIMKLYDQHDRWKIVINKEKIIKRQDYIILDIWMIQK